MKSNERLASTAFSLQYPGERLPLSASFSSAIVNLPEVTATHRRNNLCYSRNFMKAENKRGSGKQWWIFARSREWPVGKEENCWPSSFRDAFSDRSSNERTIRAPIHLPLCHHRKIFRWQGVRSVLRKTRVNPGEFQRRGRIFSLRAFHFCIVCLPLGRPRCVKYRTIGEETRRENRFSQEPLGENSRDATFTFPRDFWYRFSKLRETSSVRWIFEGHAKVKELLARTQLESRDYEWIKRYFGGSSQVACWF